MSQVKTDTDSSVSASCAPDPVYRIDCELFEPDHVTPLAFGCILADQPFAIKLSAIARPEGIVESVDDDPASVTLLDASRFSDEGCGQINSSFVKVVRWTSKDGNTLTLTESLPTWLIKPGRTRLRTMSEGVDPTFEGVDGEVTVDHWGPCPSVITDPNGLTCAEDPPWTTDRNVPDSISLLHTVIKSTDWTDGVAWLDTQIAEDIYYASLSMTLLFRPVDSEDDTRSLAGVKTALLLAGGGDFVTVDGKANAGVVNAVKTPVINRTYTITFIDGAICTSTVYSGKWREYLAHKPLWNCGGVGNSYLLPGRCPGYFRQSSYAVVVGARRGQFVWAGCYDGSSNSIWMWYDDDTPANNWGAVTYYLRQHVWPEAKDIPCLPS